MKGPYERLKYDLRRLWECPACQRRERTDGAVTFRHCLCGTKQEGGRPVVMHLVADGAQRLVPLIAQLRGCDDAPSATPPAMNPVDLQPEAPSLVPAEAFSAQPLSAPATPAVPPADES